MFREPVDDTDTVSQETIKEATNSVSINALVDDFVGMIKDSATELADMVSDPLSKIEIDFVYIDSVLRHGLAAVLLAISAKILLDVFFFNS